ncbi:MAG: PASTA domain-containing protein [Alphaproteobacteria bacterium]
MVRFLNVLILSVIAVLAPLSAQALVTPDGAWPDAGLSATAPEPAGHAAGGVTLAQAPGTDQRGPRALGAVTSSVQVPSLQCLSTQEAEVILRQQNLRLGQVHQRASNACPSGGIVAQSPPRGRTVRPGTEIEVVINAAGGGSAPVAARATVPEVIGLTPAEAQSVLRREGLDIGQIQRESAAAPLGTIVGQSPEAGAPAARGSRINITVASEVRIPDLRTLSREQAIEKLKESSLTLGRVTEESSSQPNGTIIKQWPLPGVPAAADDAVDITVAKGQTVPDLRSLTLNDARARLRDAGLRPGRVESRVSDQRRGTIIEQRPAANQVVSPGIAIDVVLAATPIVPELAGRTVEQAKRLIATQLLEVGSITSKVSNEPQGTIIEQRPRANAEASPGSAVDLVLAEGLEVPGLVGLSLQEAGAELAKKLMRLGKVERQTTAGGDGRIIDQSPAPGAAASLGISVDVTVSEPPTVPDLRGLDPEAVASRLAEKNLVLANVDFQLSASQPDQTVLSQDPAAGSPAADGGRISVVLAVTAPPPDRPDLVPVPNIAKMTAAQADQAVRAVGLELQLDGSADGERPNRVTSQIPDAGRLLTVGSSVIAQLESIDKVEVPDLLGVAQEAVDTRLADTFLTLGQQDWRLSTQPDGTVISQDPPAGTPVAFGNAVDVVFSASALIPDLSSLTPEGATRVLASQSLQLGGVEEIFSIGWPGTIVGQRPSANSPARIDSVVQVQVVGLAGPLTAAGTLLVILAGLVWFRARQGGGFAPAGAGTTPTPPPVYGISRGAVARPAFDKTARSARPAAAPAAAARAQPDFVVHADPGTQVTQTDAPNLVISSIRLRGRSDPGEQTLAIEP